MLMPANQNENGKGCEALILPVLQFHLQQKTQSWLRETAEDDADGNSDSPIEEPNNVFEY